MSLRQPGSAAESTEPLAFFVLVRSSFPPTIPLCSTRAPSIPCPSNRTVARSTTKGHELQLHPARGCPIFHLRCEVQEVNSPLPGRSKDDGRASQRPSAACASPQLPWLHPASGVHQNTFCVVVLFMYSETTVLIELPPLPTLLQPLTSGCLYGSRPPHCMFVCLIAHENFV